MKKEGKGLPISIQARLMKDFFDIAALATHESFDGATLAGAIRTTFQAPRSQGGRGRKAQAYR